MVGTAGRRPLRTLRAIDDPALFTTRRMCPTTSTAGCRQRWPAATRCSTQQWLTAELWAARLPAHGLPQRRRGRSATSCGATRWRDAGLHGSCLPDDRPPSARCGRVEGKRQPQRGVEGRGAAVRFHVRRRFPAAQLVKGRNRDTAWFSLLTTNGRRDAQPLKATGWIRQLDVDGQQRRRLNARLPLDLVDQVLQRRTRLADVVPGVPAGRTCQVLGLVQTWLMRSWPRWPSGPPGPSSRVPCHPERHLPRPSPDLLILSVLTAMMASFPTSRMPMCRCGPTAGVRVPSPELISSISKVCPQI